MIARGDAQHARRLLFRGYHAGLGNGRLSLDIGVLLAHLSGRTLCPFGHRPPWRGSPGFCQATRPIASVLDLYDVPVPLDLRHLHDADPPTPDAALWPFGPIYGAALVHPPRAPLDDPRLRAFLHGRTTIHRLEGALATAPTLRIDAPTLGVWSSYCYADPPTRRRLRALLAQIRPRAPYQALATAIAAELRPFVALHLRRGDFVSRRFTPRCAEVTGRELRDNLLTRIGPGERLVILTDSPEDHAVFAPLRQAFREVIFLEPWLLAEPRWRRALAALPHDGDDALALVAQQVAASARVFVGTLFSSFTALIQRERGLRAAGLVPGTSTGRGGEAEFLYAYDDFRDTPDAPRYRACAYLPRDPGADAPFSFARLRFPVHPIVHGWFRDWPESFQPAADEAEAEADHHAPLALGA